MTFKIGDWVQLNKIGRDYVLAWYGNKPDIQKVFLGPLQVINIVPSITMFQEKECVFLYPPSCQYAGQKFHWPFDRLELIPAAATSAIQCQCPIKLLMNRGCQCGVFQKTSATPSSTNPNGSR